MLPVCFRVPIISLRRSICTTPVRLSGHNKWSKIKEKKGVNDQKKGSLYSKATRDILLAVRIGGSADPDQNASLAAVIKRVKSEGVPKDNIDNALKKATGGKEKGSQHLVYEAMAAGSVGMIIECLTDNVNRTMHAVRNVLEDNGARFANVLFQFQRKGVVRVALDKGDDLEARSERLIEAALEAEAEDFDSTPSDDAVEMEFKCSPTALAKLTEAVTKDGLCRELISSDLVYIALEPGEAPDELAESKVSRLVELLEDTDDVLRVSTTID
ncbi:YebC-like protein [Obba rivulosa]|uniref:YebC-like protein n=1 Tax=Obba rivulosa TaxID=1052685 RepID=A0A8E2DT41_9APHY|nr:YebC-like protein [Obba rivulosa]